MRHRLHFNRKGHYGPSDRDAWVIQTYRGDGTLDGLMQFAALIKLRGVEADFVFDSAGCPAGYVDVEGTMVRDGDVVTFVKS